MSTTVKYKNNIIASLDGETKILATRGKWVENDIEITDISVDGIGEGNIYQDEDGYIIIDENNNAPIDVKPVTMLTNGEYVAPAGVAYSPVIIDTPERGEDYIDGSITYIMAEDLDGIDSIGAYAFKNCASLISIDLSNITTIKGYAFDGCTLLKEIIIPPSVNTIGSYAFVNSGLENIIIPETAINLGENLFNGCKSLKTAELRGLKTWTTSYGARNVFYNCSSLESVKIYTSMAGNGNEFYGCSSLVDVYAPKYNLVSAGTFTKCTALERIALPGNTSCYTKTFSDCTSLKAVDFGKRTQFYREQIFLNDAMLTTIILRGNTLTSLTYTNVFDGTPFANGGIGGTIYIPKILYDELGTGSSLDYKSATNWSTFDGYGTITWAQIEGSEYEHYYVDGRGVLQTVTTNLTNCSISNDIAHYHTDFETEVVANDGYSISSVAVIMNGIDITSAAYDSEINMINISSPDGEIVITATAA